MRNLLLCAVAALTVVQAAAADWKPERPIEIVAMSGPGGANDVIARTIQRYLQTYKLVPVAVTVTSRPGAGGVIAWNYLNQRAGDGGYLSISPINLLTEHIAGASPITYTDVTPIAQLFNEYVVFSVRPDAPIRSGGDLVQRMRADPASASFAVAAALGGANHIAAALTMKTAGADPRRLKFVVFNSGPQSVTAVSGGHVDITVNPVSGAAPHIESGRLRALAVTSPHRFGRVMATVPTWREQGVDVVFSTWRGVIGPRALSRDQVAYWEEVITRIVQTDEWKREMDRNYWEPGFMTSAETGKYLRAQYDQYRTILSDLGLANPRQQEK
jgi:putative tricarboxylic transport membrane protein